MALLVANELPETETQKTLDLIITCEQCGEVKYFHAANDSSVERIFTSFHCSNNCDRSFYSYITIGQINMDDYSFSSEPSL
ncbi:MAG: hypothetical protein GXO75_05360 [Calditrichaeota bacterium]|nr:hypothetical protein [Actinomycetota bacterium]NOY58351.1 hypothetical protein [Calditrichota bacterium]